jgi:hypothetical protein
LIYRDEAAHDAYQVALELTDNEVEWRYRQRWLREP